MSEFRWDWLMHDGRGASAAPSNLVSLFPEFAGRSHRLVAADSAHAARIAAARLSRRGRVVHVATPGLLLTPPFRRNRPWISAIMAAIGREGRAMPVAPSVAADRTGVAALVARLVGDELGGAFWITPPAPAGLKPRRLIVRGNREPAVTATRLGVALAHAEAARILLLMDRPDRAVAGPAADRGCTVLNGLANPWAVLDGAAAVHGDADDPLVVLARLAGVPVREDGPSEPASLEDIADRWLLAARYADPFTGRPIDAAAALDIVAEWRRVTGANRAIGAATGMSFWKRRRIAAFLHDGTRPPPHRRTGAAALRAADGRGVAAWSSRIPPDWPALAASGAGGRLLRVEDGFVRSLGLGSGFLPPCSVIVDGSGIYYDPSAPSDLETVLLRTRFDPDLLTRARRLIARLVRDGVTKYDVGRGPGAALPAIPSDGRRRILVPGQVADDLSVRLGGAGVEGNADLLARVRAANPDAFVIYKPHPDVEAGHRAGAVPESVTRAHADIVIAGAPIADLIATVDEVHTVTSLAGFEALLRGRDVVVYGQPFYAGWGLTRDLAPLPRRDRVLTLEELSAGVLLLYPRYLDPVTGLPCPAEVLLDRLADPSVWRPTALMRLRRWQGWARNRLAAL